MNKKIKILMTALIGGIGIALMINGMIGLSSYMYAFPSGNSMGENGCSFVIAKDTKNINKGDRVVYKADGEDWIHHRYLGHDKKIEYGERWVRNGTKQTWVASIETYYITKGDANSHKERINIENTNLNRVVYCV